MRPSSPTTARLRAAAVALALVLPCSRSVRAQDGDRGAFLVRIGNDTVAAERFVRTPTTLDATSMIRSPRTLVRRYSATFDAAGRLTRFELAVRRPELPADAPPMQRAVMTFRGDTAVVEIHADSTRTMLVPADRATLPLVNLGYAAYETALLRARRAGGDSVAIPMLFLGAPQPSEVAVVRLGPDSVRMQTPFGESRVRVDAEGRLLGLASPGSTQQVTVQRLPALDVEALARAFAGRGLGELSPRDTTRAELGGARLLVDYGRPLKRGRVIFGSVVPWDVVWRAGANAATTLVTDRDLVIGGTPVPRGTYTLFALPGRGGWKLIVSRKTGEWGTDYDPSADLARIDMRVTTLAEPVERFTIALRPRGPSSAVLALSWDSTEASVPVVAR